MISEVDLILLSRDLSPMRRTVREGIAAQTGVALRVHRVVGAPMPGDANRWATIARARNRGMRLGDAPWLLFLDDDVVLEPGCVRRLVDSLQARPGYAALAADYLGEASGPWNGTGRHVGMGATLFRRSARALVHFRWEPGKCECQCCCDDLRRLGLGIGYLPEARARHDHDPDRNHAVQTRKCPESPKATAAARGRASSTLSGRVLAAFNRRDLGKFRRQFLGSLRESGNGEPVTAIGYGLYPSEQRILAETPRVELRALPDDGVAPPVRRLRDFQAVVASWPEETPVAYWDAGDVIFQDRLKGLWDLVADHPDELLVVREPESHPRNTAVAGWTLSIRDPGARRRAFDLLSTRPFLNSGFAAGTARTLLAYLREADRLLHSSALAGTADWGDQTALNLYCYSVPGRARAIPDSWNYCMYARPRDKFLIRADGRFVRHDGSSIPVVHGNARSLSPYRLGF